MNLADHIHAARILGLGAGTTGPAGPIGATGPAGATGPQGAQGLIGAAGPAGPAGANGLQGATGPAGPQGSAGPTGAAGPAGPAGATGPAGANGAQGIQGIQGPPGPSGNIVVDYSPNQTVTTTLGSVTFPSGERTTNLTIYQVEVMYDINFGMWYESTYWHDCSALLQAVLWAASQMAKTIGQWNINGDMSNLTQRRCVRVTLPAGRYMLDYQLFVPELVEFHCLGSLVRITLSSTETANPSTVGRELRLRDDEFRPAVLFSNRAHCKRIHVHGNTTGDDRAGSGIVLGQNWGAAQVLIDGTAKGSGYGVGDVYELPMDTRGRFAGARVKIKTVDSFGGITSFETDASGNQVVEYAGVYPKPPKNTTSSGITLSDRYTKASGTPTNAGTGAKVRIVWEGEWKYNTWNRGNFAVVFYMVNDSIYVTGVGYKTATTKGDQFGITMGCMNCITDNIEVQGGRIGIHCRISVDNRMNNMNTVGSQRALVLDGCGSVSCPNVVLDSANLCYMEIKGSTGINLIVHCFLERQNDGATGYGQDTVYGNSTTLGKRYAIMIGENTNRRSSGMRIRATLQNTGRVDGACGALYLGYCDNSLIDIVASNKEVIIDRGTGKSQNWLNKFCHIGPEVQNSVRLRGSLDYVAKTAMFTKSTGANTGFNAQVLCADPTGVHNAAPSVMLKFGAEETITV